MNFAQIAKILIIAGIALAVLGGLLFLFSKIPFMGNLPGDIHIKRENFSIHIPIATSIILSIVLTIILNIIIRFILRR